MPHLGVFCQLTVVLLHYEKGAESVEMVCAKTQPGQPPLCALKDCLHESKILEVGCKWAVGPEVLITDAIEEEPVECNVQILILDGDASRVVIPDDILKAVEDLDNGDHKSNHDVEGILRFTMHSLDNSVL